MKRHYFSILFFIRKTKLLKNGEAPVCLRVTVDGQRFEIQIKRSVNLSNWDHKKGFAIGRDAKSMELNHYLEVVRTKILRIHRELEQDNNPITAQIIIKIFNGKSDKDKMLLSFFDEQNKKRRELIGKDYVLSTVLRFERTVKYLQEYIQFNYQLSDIPLKNIDNFFILNFEHFIKIQKKCAQNATIKYLKILKQIIKLALINKYIDADPFAGIHFHQTKSKRIFLTDGEIKILLEKEYSIQRLEVVRDIFIFCCFTGLAFVDVKNLQNQHIISDNKGNMWIFKTREKTENMCHIPLLDIPLQIIEKYKSDQECQKVDYLLPVPSCQRMNSYLKEIADTCGIQKTLTTHVARHTFACLALANKISIDTIAKILGHDDIRTTKLYAKVQDVTIIDEMQTIKKNWKNYTFA